MAKAEDTEYLDIKSPVIRRMRSNYRLSLAAEEENRREGLIAVQFKLGGDHQWHESDIKLRKADGRRYESYNQIPQFIHQVSNDMRMNMPQIRFIPQTDEDQEKAEVYEDLARAIQVSGEGETACDAAADCQLSNGWGYWRYVTDYESNDSFDQIIKPRWIPNAFTVFDDPATQSQDRSDRRFLIEVSDMRRNDYNADYDKDCTSSDLQAIGTQMPQWADTHKDLIRIAEYWELTERTKYLKRGSKTLSDKQPKGEENIDWRKISEPVVKWYKCTANEVLEEAEWPGILIPYVFVAGETTNIDGKWIYRGMVHRMMPAQRQYNYYNNTADELANMSPKAPFIADSRAIEGLEQFWAESNVASRAYLPFRGVDSNGNPIPEPKRQQNSADLASASAMMQMAQENLYRTSGISQSGLGLKSNESSGKAILARQREGDTSTFHFPDNMARALRCAGRILADLIPKIYDASRTIKGVKEDKTIREIKINKPHKDDKGREKNFDLTVGVYDVMVTTGPSFTTRRQESAEAMLQLAQSTNLMEIAPDKFYRAQDWPGAQDIADRYEATPVIQQLIGAQEELEEGAEERIPPAFKQQLAQLQQAAEVMGQELQAAQTELQSKQAETAVKMADVQNKQGDLQLKSQQQQLDAEDKARQAQLDQMQMQLEAEKLANEREKLVLEGQKLEIERMRLQIEAIQPQQAGVAAATSAPTVNTNDKNALQAQILTLQEQEANEHARREQEMMQEQQAQAFDVQKTQLILDGMAGIQSNLADLTASINAPKQVIRDANGMVAGVSTVGT